MDNVMGRTGINFNGILLQQPLTREARYWLGFLLADGCLYYSRGYPVISINVAKVDQQHLIDFATFCSVTSHAFDLPGHLGRSIGRQVRFAISREQAEQFSEYGIVPRKSMKEVPPQGLIHDIDWWRGMIDGDGSLGLYRGCPQLSICGSMETCEAFSCLVQNITQHKPQVIEISKSFYRCVAGGGNNSQPVIRKIYYEGCFPVLQRKMMIAEKCFTWISQRKRISMDAKICIRQEKMHAST